MRRWILALAACLVAAALLPAAASAEKTGPFEIVPGSFKVVPSSFKAGDHGNVTTEFSFVDPPGSEVNGNQVKTTLVEVPPGFIGNPTSVPSCPASKLIGGGISSNCPLNTQIGTIGFTIYLFGTQAIPITKLPLYNMAASSKGIAGEWGFTLLNIVSQQLPITVRPDDSGLDIESPDIEALGIISHVILTTWGVPASHENDKYRGALCFEFGGSEFCEGGEQELQESPVPYLSNPTSCSGAPLEARLKANAWQEQSPIQEQSFQVSPMVECDRVPFEPSIAIQPTTNAAETPTGLEFTMSVPQAWNNPITLSTANLKDVTVTLPKGFAINPSAGSGLGTCTPQQFAEESVDSLPGEHCPNESRIGSVEVESPVIDEKMQGSLYIASPHNNPFNSLLALYIVARVPQKGVMVKLAGQVTPDPATGQLTTTFNGNPQLPFSKFSLKFNQGATAPLSSPPLCGTFTAEADLAPWSAPSEPRHLLASTQIANGVHNGACPSGGTPPFHPGLIAGTINPEAGGYSPFYVRISREDGEQEVTHFSLKLPPGVSGKLAGIPYCPDSAIAAAKSKTGLQEQSSPSCPAASEVGHTFVGAGVGTLQAQAPGKVYLAGPYNGSAVSVVAITSALVGPFDLGTVVVREGFKVNPDTGEVFIDAAGSDPIPHIIDGIPIHLRDVRIYIDRNEFVLNPTSCAPTSAAATVLGSGTDFVSEADDNPVTVGVPFQAVNCTALPFQPDLTLKLIGASHRGGHPALHAILTAKPGEANIEETAVTLPRSEFLENANIRTVCTRVQFNSGTTPGENCPADSVYGAAKAVTPILDEPLAGPVFLRSNPEHPLPDLVAALHSGKININLAGRVDSVNGGIRTTFERVPDAPVSRFELNMDGGSKSLIVNSANACKGKHKATSLMTGQNGAFHDTNPVLKAQCKKPKKKKKKRHSHRRALHRGRTAG
jgi:hypothetical protein